MIINTLLKYKATQIQPERCQVDVVVSLDHWEFERLINCTLDDFDFIKESLDELPVSNDNTRHCIMALDETADDGILIDPQGYNYPRYAAYVSNAKQLLTLEQYPSLQSYNDNNHAHVLDVCLGLNLKFICYYINAISLRPYVTGTAQPKMNQENMNAIWVPLPPLAEQKRIVQKLEQILPLCERLK